MSQRELMTPHDVGAFTEWRLIIAEVLQEFERETNEINEDWAYSRLNLFKEQMACEGAEKDGTPFHGVRVLQGLRPDESIKALRMKVQRFDSLMALSQNRNAEHVQGLSGKLSLWLRWFCFRLCGEVALRGGTSDDFRLLVEPL